MSDQLLTHRPATDDELDAVTQFVRNADELFYAFPRAHWPLSREQLCTLQAEDILASRVFGASAQEI